MNSFAVFASSYKRILAVMHHLSILAARASLEWWRIERFIHMDAHDKSMNCGVALYRGSPNLGKNGHSELDFYNKKYF